MSDGLPLRCRRTAARACSAPPITIVFGLKVTSCWHPGYLSRDAHHWLAPRCTGIDTLAAKGASYCFVDTAPAITEQTAAVLSLADLVVVPVRPSPADLWAVGGTTELVRRAGKPFLFVLTQAKPQASITAQAVAALSEHGRVARSFIADRVAYAAAMTSGNTAPELWPKGPTAGEIDALWTELKSCFAENMKIREVA